MDAARRGLNCSRLALIMVLAAAFMPVGLLLAAEEMESPSRVEGLSHPLDGPGIEDIARIWRGCLGAYAQAEYSELLLQLDRLRMAQPDSGIANLSPISAALVRIAVRIADSNPSEIDVALSVARHAQLLSPDLPDFSFSRSNLIWRYDRSRVGELARDFFQGLRQTFSHPPALRALLLSAVAVVWGAGILVMAIFSLMLLARYLSLFAHDFGHLLPRVLSKLQLNIIVLILLSIPFLADLGAVPLFALWWVVLWVYMARTEKIVTVAMVLFIYLWPLANGLFVGGMEYTGSLAQKAQTCRTQMCSWKEIRELEAADPAQRGWSLALFSAAGAWFRDAHREQRALEHSFDTFKKGVRDVPGRDKALFHVGLGNVFTVKGMLRCRKGGGNLDAGLDDFQTANKNYDAALALDPQDWVALYNKYRVLTVLGMNDEARRAHDRAFALAPRKVNELRERAGPIEERQCVEAFVGNRQLAMPEVSTSLLASGAGTAQDGGTMPGAHALLLGPMKTWSVAVLATAVLLCVVALAAVRKRLNPSSRCIKCNEIACVKCRPELMGTGQCNRCVYYKIRSSYMDPKETWLREKRIESSLRLRRKLETFLTFVFPGSGHMLRGRAIRGAAFMWLLVASLSFIFLPPVGAALAWIPLTPFSSGSAITVGLYTVSAVVVYFLCLLDIYSWR